MLGKDQRVIVAMMDGLDMEYVEQTTMPNFHMLMEKGLFKEVSGVFPSVTNVNNVSIASGTWPNQHGISANSFFNKNTGKPEYMNSHELIKCSTIFKRAKEMGIKSALLTSKKKTLELFRDDVTIGIAAEAPTDDVIEKYGKPADIYSREINYWLWEVANTILRDQPEIGLLYVHITDYPMHAWGPEQDESKEHLENLDQLIGIALEVAPDAALLATADHGMNYKTQCWDLEKVLRKEGIPARFVLSPERDYYIVHHRNFTGCSWIWLEDPENPKPTITVLENLAGVEEVVTRDEAVKRYNLVPEHIGDLVVMGDKETMFGEMDEAYENLSDDYRAHGSLYEMRLPLVVWNLNGDLPAEEDLNFNLDLTKKLYR